jgi:CxxC-x17-CxxC domain-containing protein
MDERDMFDAVCDQCGSNCKLPFQPSSGKPIYCSSCFEKRGGGKSNDSRGSYGNDRGGRRDDRRGRRDDRRDDRRPTFTPPPQVSKEDIEKINLKLDLIIAKLSNVVPRETSSGEVELKEMKKVRIEEEGISLK